MAQIKLVTVQTSQSPPDSIPSNLPPSTQNASVFSIVYVLGLFAAYGVSLWATVRQRKDALTKQSSLVGGNIPCRSCRFFSNNYYLKCAVNPSIVMTQNAINCSDYCPTQKVLKKMKQKVFDREQ